MSRIVAAVALFVTALAGAAPRAQPPSELQQIQARGRLVALVVRDPAMADFFDLASRERPGFDRQMLEGFARAQGVSLAVELVPDWQALVPALLARRGDLIAGDVTATATRRRLGVRFTREVLPTRHVLVSPRGRPVGLAELRAGRAKVGVQPGTSEADALLAEGVSPSAHVPIGAGEGSQALASGRVPAVVWGLEVAVLLARRDRSLELGELVGPAASLAYGVRASDDGTLAAALDAHIAEMRRSAGYLDAARKYFGPALLQLIEGQKR